MSVISSKRRLVSVDCCCLALVTVSDGPCLWQLQVRHVVGRQLLLSEPDVRLRPEGRVGDLRVIAPSFYAGHVTRHAAWLTDMPQTGWGQMKGHVDVAVVATDMLLICLQFYYKIT